MSAYRMSWHQDRHPRREEGLSMIELMVALVLSSILTLGVLTIYLDSNDTSRMSESLARVQEAGRIALGIMARDIRMSGFQGCSDPMQDIAPNFTASSLDGDFFGAGLRGVEVGGSNWESATGHIDVNNIKTSAISGTDVVQVRRASAPVAVLDSDMATAGSVIQTVDENGAKDFTLGEAALITNCVNADVFTVENEDGETEQIKHSSLSNVYPAGSRVFHFSTDTYWVQDTGRQDDQGNAVFGLYQNGSEIVAGVERLQVQYGVREGDNIRYGGAADVNDDEWNDVEAIRVGLLVSDAQSVMANSDAKDYDLPGLTVQPAGTAGAAATYPDDRRLRRVFVTTIKLRNQIPTT
ncbi:PilW family protein [Tamilnaduibacter salinus]|uniref:Pilus assembly protein PilW n=2 Tax=Tamilnaduibacter salinus TaxID=1484056 RepID=A0A2A2I0M8_9GAMM|nr:PilW family protein [Tamilnaduibacter salinus]PAV25162.1 pilus assembly protein PilW [Tamilnaduibacter salinus]